MMIVEVPVRTIKDEVAAIVAEQPRGYQSMYAQGVLATLNWLLDGGPAPHTLMDDWIPSPLVKH